MHVVHENRFGSLCVPNANLCTNVWQYARQNEMETETGIARKGRARARKEGGKQENYLAIYDSFLALTRARFPANSSAYYQ